MAHRLVVVMYHYVRDLPRTRFPRLNGLHTDAFRTQVDTLSERFEMATLESALAFLSGRYEPPRDLCLLTFDDGLGEHGGTVTPMLSQRGIQGLFFIPTAAIAERRVLAVHKNHFLMAELDFQEYRSAVLGELGRLSPDTPLDVQPSVAAATYRWDRPEVAAFKYLLNFSMTEPIRERILHDLFVRYIGDEPAFARTLYVDWAEARDMQRAGMVIGGHSHNHVALARLNETERRRDIETCTELLHEHLLPQPAWPFSYPYGKSDSFGDAAARTVLESGYACAFATETGWNRPGCDVFLLKRVDSKDMS